MSGEKFGSSGAGTAGRARRYFIAAVGIDMAANAHNAIPTMTLRNRALVRALPELGQVVKALPGSAGVAAQLAENNALAAAKKESARAPAPSDGKQKTAVPVLLVSGPRGVGKSTLVKRLVNQDPRFKEPQWVVSSAAGGSVSEGRKVMDEEEFEEMEMNGGFAVSFRPYGDDGVQLGLGLEVTAVVEAALSSASKTPQACVLDVDPPTARAFLSFNWGRAFEGTSFELRPVGVWVCVPSLDDVVERNRQRLMRSAAPAAASIVEKQVSPLRAQAAADTEWALTSGCFDFTVENKDEDTAAAELVKASQYCFSDQY